MLVTCCRNVSFDIEHFLTTKLMSWRQFSKFLVPNFKSLQILVLEVMRTKLGCNTK